LYFVLFNINSIIITCILYFKYFYFIAENANIEIGASNECTTEDLAKEMKNQKVLTFIEMTFLS